MKSKHKEFFNILDAYLIGYFQAIYSTVNVAICHEITQFGVIIEVVIKLDRQIRGIACLAPEVLEGMTKVNEPLPQLFNELRWALRESLEIYIEYTPLIHEVEEN